MVEMLERKRHCSLPRIEQGVAMLPITVLDRRFHDAAAAPSVAFAPKTAENRRDLGQADPKTQQPALIGMTCCIGTSRKDATGLRNLGMRPTQ